jgi:tetratricopeptide (TPR) repeat protein
MPPLETPEAPMYIRGVFSCETRNVVGFGGTKKSTSNKMYVFAKQVEDGVISLQFINQKNVPSGPSQDISTEEFLATYVPEPQFYQQEVLPAMRELTKTIAKAERYRDHGKFFSSEMEFKNALRIDEENIRATFGLGLVYLDRKESETADMVFRRLVAMEAAFEKEHKHLFNEFGMSLRKAGMYDQAMQFYSRAQELGKGDENLYYNMARAMYEQGRPARAMKFLRKALDINPAFEECIGFVRFLNKNVKDDASSNSH